MSAGNVSLLSPLGVLLVLALLGAYQFLSGVNIPRAYSGQEKDAALDALAVALLLVRDRRLDQQQHQPGDDVGKETTAAKVGQAGSGAIIGDARRAAVLAELVEALADTAAAVDGNPSLCWQRSAEPVHVDWGRLQAKVLWSASAAGTSGNGNNRKDRAGPERDVDTDVELATVSKMHPSSQQQQSIDRGSS